MHYMKELEAAVAISRRAGEVAMKYFSGTTTAESKADGSPVTIADRECEKVISRFLGEIFPDDGITGEEGAFQTPRSTRRWLIDPIDGTRDFVRRTRFWSNLLTLQISGEVVLGVMYFPCLNELYHAVSGGGCFFNGTRVVASNVDRLDKALLTVGGFPSVWRMWPPEGVRYLTENCWTVRAYGGCYDVAMLVRGMSDIWLSGSGMEWDYGPARILAAEAGAIFRTRDGSSRIDANHCMLCAPGLETEVCRILDIAP